MMAVLGSVPIDHLVAPIVLLKGEIHLQDMGAGLDDLQDS